MLGAISSHLDDPKIFCKQLFSILQVHIHAFPLEICFYANFWIFQHALIYRAFQKDGCIRNPIHCIHDLPFYKISWTDLYGPIKLRLAQSYIIVYDSIKLRSALALALFAYFVHSYWTYWDPWLKHSWKLE